MLIRLISLLRFHLDCLLAYFRPGARWSAATPFYMLRQAGYYFANECYCWFIYSAEALAFLNQTRLRAVDRALNKRYFYPSQFMLALREGLKVERPETLYRLTYGETTWFGIRTALKAVNASSQDVFYDLGCGTGRNVFFAHLIYGMKALGVDLLPSFVNHAQAVTQEFGLQNVTFLEQNIFHTDLSEASIVYITANCYDAETMAHLVTRLNDLKPGARVISTHRTIPHPRLKVIGHQRVPFSWGVDQMYFQLVTSES